jgi:hypothetical protein
MLRNVKNGHCETRKGTVANAFDLCPFLVIELHIQDANGIGFRLMAVIRSLRQCCPGNYQIGNAE